MQEFVVFLFTQLGNVILWLDSIELFGTITLFKLIVIVMIYTLIMKFLGGGANE